MALHSLNISKDISGRWPYRLFTTLSRGEKLIKDAFVDILPIHYEELSTVVPRLKDSSDERPPHFYDKFK